MNILGLSVFNDAAAAIVSEGKVLCAIEEERLNRIKHYCGMPWLAIRECLDVTGMSPDDIDIVTFGWNPFRGWGTRVGTTVTSFLHNPWNWRNKAIRGSDYLHGCHEIIRFRETFLRKYAFSRYKGKITYISHHLAHAASAYLASEYSFTDIIVADGIGEYASISLFRGDRDGISRIHEIPFPHSLGHVYASVTGFLGFKMCSDEGKVMALASYGRDRFHDLLNDLIRLDPKENNIRIDISLLDYHAACRNQFSKSWLQRTSMKPRSACEPVEEIHADLACSLQKRVETAALFLIRNHFPGNRNRPLCAAGGFFLNSVLNGRIIKECTRDLFVQPAAGDNGVSVGAALHESARFDHNYKRHPWKTAALGRSFTENDIVNAILAHDMSPRKSGNVFSETATLIKQGKVVAWFRGRMEFGPRALGNRSILADPTRKNMKDNINLKIKHREAFRPFAASVLSEETSEYFHETGQSPFMLKVFHFREKFRETFPAICHVDGTCRLQIVTEHNAPDLYALLQQLKNLSGYGMVLNTSLNIAGEPIVNTPEEAIELLKNTDVDVLVLEDYIVYNEILKV